MRVIALALALWAAAFGAGRAQTATPIRVEGGLLSAAAPDASGVRVFRAVPYAAPPVGPGRWREPSPVVAWTGVRPTDRFGANCMQPKAFGDIDPTTPGMSEDCLFLNVWTPAKAADARLPVMVWIHGGGFVAGSGSEPRHDGTALARQGVVVVTINYRLGAFGALATPELSAETAWKGSGNWGLMDQIAALEWVQRNITAFGGDPAKVTVFGESAGSWSVSALTASPLAKGLFRGAIGESGAVFGSTLRPVQSLEQAQVAGAAFAAAAGAPTLAQLRALPAEALLKLPFEPVPAVDGRVLPDAPERLIASGRGNPVPLIYGSTSAEGSFGLFQRAPYEGVVAKLAGSDGAALKDTLPADPKAAEETLGGDLMIGYPTWAWAATLRREAGVKTWSYLFDRRIGAPDGVRGRAQHADDIVFAFDHPDRREGFTAVETDRRVAAAMSGYLVNFAKTLDPNGPGLPPWPAYAPEKGADARMRFADAPAAEPDTTLKRYRLLQRFLAKGPPSAP